MKLLEALKGIILYITYRQTKRKIKKFKKVVDSLKRL
jgi:uncharacterized protein YlbG (UPF0298 family)